MGLRGGDLVDLRGTGYGDQRRYCALFFSNQLPPQRPLYQEDGDRRLWLDGVRDDDTAIEWLIRTAAAHHLQPRFDHSGPAGSLLFHLVEGR